MKLSAQIKWIFFDVGSTLVDESLCYERRLKEIADKSGLSYERVYALALSFYQRNLKGDLEAAKSLGVELEPWQHCDEVPYEGAAELLENLSRKYRIGIIANQSRGTAQRLDAYGLGRWIDLVISSAEEGVSKPDHRIFEIALQRSGCRPDAALMVGDRIDNDILPAKAMGMHTAWIRQGFGRFWKIGDESEKPDFSVECLRELGDILLG